MLLETFLPIPGDKRNYSMFQDLTFTDEVHIIIPNKKETLHEKMAS